MATFLVYRHGVRRSGGFVFLVIFTIVRIVGACCELATINSPSTGLYTAAAICSSIGLSPHLMTCLGLLSRANECMPRPLIHMFAFTFFRAVTIGSLLLTASGLTWNITLDGLKYLSVVVKVGMILYLVSWFVMCMFFGILFLYQSSIENGKSLALVAVAISAPFIPVRIIYAMLLFFLANSTFNMIDGSNTVQLVMSVFHKLIVLFVCLPVGFTLTVWEQHWKSVPGLEVA